MTDLVVGSGDAAVAGKNVTVNYTGWLHSNTEAENKGTQFDTGNGVQFRLARSSRAGTPVFRHAGRRRPPHRRPARIGHGAAGSGTTHPAECHAALRDRARLVP
ncbi:MAG: hypothetical protein R2712_30495 [Vicinamibacterales bacterium]